MATETRAIQILAFILMFASGLPSVASSDPKTCGVFERADPGTQLIPSKGGVKTKVASGESVPCGSMILTRQGVARVRLEDRTTVQVAPGSFVEFQGGGVRSLYRGEVLVSGPVLSIEQLF